MVRERLGCHTEIPLASTQRAVIRFRRTYGAISKLGYMDKANLEGRVYIITYVWNIGHKGYDVAQLCWRVQRTCISLGPGASLVQPWHPSRYDTKFMLKMTYILNK